MISVIWKQVSVKRNFKNTLYNSSNEVWNLPKSIGAMHCGIGCSRSGANIPDLDPFQIWNFEWQRSQCMWFTHGWQRLSPTGTQTYCHLDSLKGLMEALNKLCLCPCTWPWISRHAWAKFNRGQSVQVQAQELSIPSSQWGITHINGTHRLPNFWPFISPLHQPTSVFTKYCHPKSYFFHTVQSFGNFSLKHPAGIFALHAR